MLWGFGVLGLQGLRVSGRHGLRASGLKASVFQVTFFCEVGPGQVWPRPNQVRWVGSGRAVWQIKLGEVRSGQIR